MTEQKADAQRPEVVDPNNVPVIFVDWIVTVGVFENVVNLTLGSIDSSMKKTNDDIPRIIVNARLRCTTEFIHRLATNLTEILPKDGQTQPPPSPMPLNEARALIDHLLRSWLG